MVIDNWCNHLGVCTVTLPWEVLKRKSSDPWCMFAPGVSLASPNTQVSGGTILSSARGSPRRVWICQFLVGCMRFKKLVGFLVIIILVFSRNIGTYRGRKLPGGATKIRTHKVCERLRKDTHPSSNLKKLEVGWLQPGVQSNKTSSSHLQDIEPFQFYSYIIVQSFRRMKNMTCLTKMS